jgi:hypothetical protein
MSVHIQVNAPAPTEELVEQVGPVLAKHLVETKVQQERPALAKAQAFQENVVARDNERGRRGAEGLGQCVARIDVALYDRIVKKHAFEIAVDSKKFWLSTAPQLYPQLGIKPRYVAKTGISLAGVRRLGGARR